MVSIIILTHDAPEYVERTLTSLQKTEMVDYETIVLDNASGKETKELLWKLYGQGMIDKLIFENENTFFSRGNNLAANFCDKKSDHILLLNSDVEILSPCWLGQLLGAHKPGVTSLGMSRLKANKEDLPFYLADGYCFLIDRDEYEKHQMDTKYEFWYSLPTLELAVLKDKKRVCAIKNHEELLHHFGAKSGFDWKKAKGINSPPQYSRIEKNLLRKIEIIHSLTEELGSTIETCDFLSGYHEDKWCEPTVNLRLYSGENGKLNINGYIPNIPKNENKISIIINGHLVKRVTINSQNFIISVKVPAQSKLSIQIKANFSFQADAPDIRRLSYILSDLSAE